MKLKTLLNKTADSVKLILAQPTMIFRNKSEVELLNAAHIVDEDESARPDLIALQYYGDQSKLEMILKWNAISDPFSITEGDVLEIPNANIQFFKLDRPKEFEENPTKQQFVDNKRLSQKDQRRLDALKKKYGKENLLPPNVIPVGKKNYEYDGTRIRMGAQVQTDAVVNAINRNLDVESIDDGANLPGSGIVIGGDNTGPEFEKIPGGVWAWTGSIWVAVNPDVAQEVAGSLYDSFGNPNGNITGSFEGQLYFDRPEDNDVEPDAVDTTGQIADNPGDNTIDGGNPTASNNSNVNASGGNTTAGNCD